uniref:Myb-like domain-containing protein n=1 Tax=Knipowitschia caucasica TaxID=637954 RepID=A0AAV2KQ61_KNICA
MDRTRAVQDSSRNTIRTDLNLLLECLKFQMKCPDLQKQALLTIHSICEKRENNVELLREMGGVAFLLNLSKSNIVQSDIKETALFTLGTLAEANVYCKNSLCKKEIFTDLADQLMTEEASLGKKRVMVYFMSVLVSNNKLGQTLAQNTGCLDILLNLFRATFPLSAEGIFRTASSTQLHHLWTSVSSALCGCVNNPQNEEGQSVCVTVFPIVKNWIQQISLPQTELFQPICSFVAMTVANNTCVQECFSASGGLENLTLALIRFCLESETSLLACQLAVSTSKTLSACISDNRALASDLAKYRVIGHLFSLLTNPKLESEERLSVLLTMGHCTESAEDTTEEVRKAATFILQTCKQATNALGASDMMKREPHEKILDTNIDKYNNSAKEILHRINQLEKKQAEAERVLAYPHMIQESMSPPVTENTPRKTFGRTEEGKDLIVRLNRNLNCNKVKGIGQEDEAYNLESYRPWWATYNSTRTIQATCTEQRLEGAREPLENGQAFKIPPPKWKTAEEDNYLVEEDMKSGTNQVVEEGSISDLRCTGCILRLDQVDSRTFPSLQSSWTHSCDMHRVLREATERYLTNSRSLCTQQEQMNPSTPRSHKNLKNLRGVRLTPSKTPSQIKCFQVEEQSRKSNDIRLTPLHKGMKTAGPAFFQRPEVTTKSPPLHQSDDTMGTEACSNCSSQRRKRQDFSREEELYLLCGVKTYGPSWNAILWSYPFQTSRTNVDLAKKYRRLMKNNTLGEGLD